jgi:hypothetical protein
LHSPDFGRSAAINENKLSTLNMAFHTTPKSYRESAPARACRLIAQGTAPRIVGSMPARNDKDIG